MNKLIYSLLLLAISIALISCGKEDLLDKDQKTDVWEKGDQKSDETDKVYKDWDCFQLIFPVSVEMPNGDVILGEDQEDLNTSIKSWYENHPDFSAKYEFIYPIEISYIELDEVYTIHSKYELIETKEKCEKDGWNDKLCFELVYPISVEMPDGSIVTGENKETLHTAVKNWYLDHPDSNGKYALVYPVEIRYLEFDKVFTINNKEELIEAKKKCEKDNWKDKPCFELIFPISVEMPDGSVITGETKENLHTDIKTWYEEHPDNNGKFELIYPIEINYIGKDFVLIINNEAEMIEAKKDCK